MKILLYKWNTIGQESLEHAFCSLGHQVDTISYVMKSFEEEPVFAPMLRARLSDAGYDFVFSFNYFPIISNICQEFYTTYISWTIDSPLLQLYSSSVYNSCNHIFSFDSKVTEDMQKLGVEHIYNLPLAVEENHYRNLSLTDDDHQKYSCGISFVGSTYQNKSFYDKITNLPPRLKGYLEGVMASQECVFCYNFLEEMLTPDIMDELSQYVSLRLGKEFTGSPAMVFANSFLGMKVTERERIHLLDAVSRQYSLDIYTKDDISTTLPCARNCGTVNYHSEMPKVFHCSKINLNITLRNIQRGIPQRVFDVLASGGFLITNYQSDLYPYLIDGEDLVMYHDKEDLLDKTGYYLAHDDERKAIAESGRKKVIGQHTYQQRILHILSTVF